MDTRKVTPEDIAAAEQFLSDEDRQASETRAENYIQSQAELRAQMPKVTSHESRRPISEQETVHLDKELTEISNLFQQAGVRWFLDGATNISVFSGEYIGAHKDIDVSVDERDLSTLASHLDKSGYGFFTSQIEGNKRKVRRVGVDELSKHKVNFIIPVDASGKIDSDRTVKSIDMHTYRENSDGTFSYPGRSEVELPKEWFVPQKATLRGIEVSASHPALVAYYKSRIKEKRKYDRDDLQLLIKLGKLSPEGIEQIERTLIDEQRVLSKPDEWLNQRIALLRTFKK